MDKNKKTDELSHTLSHAHDSCSLNKNNTATLEKKEDSCNSDHDAELKSEIQNEIIDIIANIAKIKDKSTISNDTALSNLGLDSIDHTEVMLAIEDKFRHSIPDEATSKLITIKDIVEYILPYKKALTK
ncbi:acyl carrier protein [Orientia tsutsugamushi]|uniref:Phosphopantetheine attachment site family protein n=2 Tax=Orientia tsutsugamushi TaxID=784 RepID=A0A0F3PCJ3_ORITS|nr:acyl carrier protein [Orientia tsutsugamushi]KJV77647.1 phosphopantetheine attachment site family protein [Orientia tsutsugamushi str. TA716]SPM46261.1 acyl carrier protein [Orientia tsutsugamushi]